jgi:hypothetical protein
MKESRMAVVGNWSWWTRSYAFDDTIDWTHDVEMAPSSVLCQTYLSEVGASGAVTGVVAWRIRDPETGVDALHHSISEPEAILGADNCDSVTFWFRTVGGSIGAAGFNILFWE